MSQPSVTTVSVRTGLVLVFFTVTFTALMALTYGATRDIIAASAEQEKMKLVNEVLPPDSYDNALLSDYVELPPTPELGLDRPSRVFRAKRGGRPAGLVFDAIAPDGYSGRIRLLLAVRADGRLAGVRVTEHKETPGLGDYIDPRKDRNKARPWIGQFTDAIYAAPEWKLKKDGGRFDYVTGATVSARAVTRASGKAAAWALANKERLFAEAPLPKP